MQAFMVLLIELIGTVAFSISGAMVGIRKRMDIFGVLVLGVVTAVGGGMMRDVILGKTPSAFLKPIYVEVAVISALIPFIILYVNKKMVHSKYQDFYAIVMFLMDSLGLGIFTAMGISTGVNAGYEDNMFFLCFLGTLTGVGGGLLRDVMAGVPPYIFVKHIYALASIAGACVFVLLYRNFGEIPALLVASVLVVVIRLLAAHFHWNLPRLKIRA